MAQEFDVFLSHHSGDKPWVIALKAALVERGITVWLDQDEIRPGDLFIDALEQGIQASRCVALVISPESLKSAWVKDEFHRALVLSNSAQSETRIIPCLLRNASTPGFLANRHYVDFRDPREFDVRVDELCHGITGRKPDRSGRSRPAIPQQPSQREITHTEIAFLEKLIAALKKDRFWISLVRILAPVLGLVIGLQWPAVDGTFSGLLYVGAPVFMGLLCFGVTARQWSVQRDELKRLTAHRDALQLCSQSFGPVCPDVIEEFNRLLKRRIGIDSSEKGEVRA
jgi:hypothetical protein